MSSLRDLLKARFNLTTRYLNQVLDKLTDNDLTWAPADGMRTIAGQLFEIAGKERECIAWLQTGVYDDSVDVFDINTATLSEIRGVLRTLRNETFAYIDSLTEAELSEPMRPPDVWWEALGLEECPKHEVLRNISAHEWYHTGQLITYLWMRNDDPYNW